METTANQKTNEFKPQTKTKSPLAVDQSPRNKTSIVSGLFPLEETYNQIKSKTLESYDSSLQMVKRNPIRSLALALGVGAAAGYLLKRRH